MHPGAATELVRRVGSRRLWWQRTGSDDNALADSASVWWHAAVWCGTQEALAQARVQCAFTGLRSSLRAVAPFVRV